MRTVDMQSWPRREHFAKFAAFHQPHFNVCADVEVTALRQAVKERDVSFTAALVYVVARVSNDIPEFRYRIRGETVVEHEVVHPSVTILVDEDLFSFCSFDYSEDFSVFASHVAKRIAQVKEQPTLAELPQRDDLLFMTAIPWISFTSFTHPIPTMAADSIPRFAWGKFHQEAESVKMPLSVQGHHALMDGLHVGRYYETAETYLQHPGSFLDGSQT